MKDELFSTSNNAPFEFSQAVASVFDDMISRSVPYYDISSKIICELLCDLLPQNASVCDIGCSTASLLLFLAQARSDLVLCGLDLSVPMIELASKKAQAYGAKIELICADASKCQLQKCDAFIVNYTLQFISTQNRASFLERIFSALNPGGILIFSEKLIYDESTLNASITRLYENYKQAQGYSKTQIANKRKALENVLVPFSEAKNRELLINAGFKSVESIFKWGNFATFLGRKFI